MFKYKKKKELKIYIIQVGNSTANNLQFHHNF